MSAVQREVLRQTLAVLAGAGAIGVSGWLHSIGETSLLLWWSAGVIAGLLLRFGPGLWFAMWCGAIGAQLALDASLAAASVPASGLVGGPALLAAWLRRRGFRSDFPARGDMLRFVLATAVAMTIPPTLTLLGMHVLKVLPEPTDSVSHALQWWSHGTIAVLLIAPAIANLSRATLAGWSRDAESLLAALAAALAMALANVALPDALLQVTTMPVSMLLAVYVAQRTDLVFGSLYCLVVVMSMILRVEPGNPGQVFALVVAGTALLVRSMFAERRRMQQQLHEDEASHRAGLLRAAAQEQWRIGRDMHDTIGQELTAVSLLARIIQIRAQTLAPQLIADADAAQLACGRATHAARAISRQLLAARSDEPEPRP